MRTALGLALVCLLVMASAVAFAFEDPLLDRFVGRWVLAGTMAGGEVIHDIDADWVLGHHYLRFHEASREREADGSLAYEATVIIGWDAESGQYVCLWLDSTGGEGLHNGILGRAGRRPDQVAFLFEMGPGSLFHTTFSYDRAADTWTWKMDAEGTDGAMRPFTRATMTRRP